MHLKSSLGFAFLAVFAAYSQLETCSAGTSQATKLISGIWTEEGCIVPQDDKSRKIWGVATVWLMDDPIQPCNSPCGCPPEGLNPPFVVKPQPNYQNSDNDVPFLVGPPVQIPSFNRLPTPPPQPIRLPPFVNGIPPGCIPAPPGFIGPSPPVAPPFIAPHPPHFVGPLPPPVPVPQRVPFQPISFAPPPVPVLPPPPARIPFQPIPYVPSPTIKPIIEKVPIDFGFSKVPLPTLPVSGSIATGIPLIASPPQVDIAAGSTTVTQQDWDKEKFNANYDKDKGSKQTVTTSGGTSALVAVPQSQPPCQLNSVSPVAATAGTTSVTQEDWDKEKFNANYDKDKGSKQTVSTTAATSAPVAAPLALTQPTPFYRPLGPPPPVLGPIPHVDVGILLPPYHPPPFGVILPPLQHPPPFVGPLPFPGPLVPFPPQRVVQPIATPQVVGTGGSSTFTKEEWDKEKLNANYDKNKGSKQTITTTGGTPAVIAAPSAQPCLCASVSQPVSVAGTAPTSTITQEDWDKENMNLNYDKDKGSKTNITSSVGTGVGAFTPNPFRAPPPLYGPPLPPPVFGPIPHVDILLHQPYHFGPIVPPLQNPPFVGPFVPFPPQGGVQPISTPQVVGTGGSNTVTQEEWDKEKLNANYDKNKGSKQTITTTGGTSALVAAPTSQPCLCASVSQPVVSVVGTAPTSTITQEDWDKQNMNLNYDKDKGSKTHVTSVGTGVGLGDGGMFTPDPYRAPPPLYGPVVGPSIPLPGPAPHHVDIGILLPPPHPGPFVAVIPPPHHPPFVGSHPVTGPPAPFLPHGGVLPIPPSVPGHEFSAFGPPPPLNPVEFGPHPSLVPSEGFPLEQPHHAVPPHHGLPALISKLPVVGSVLKPVLEQVLIDFGDTPTNVPVPLDNTPTIPQSFPAPSIIGPDTLPPPPPPSSNLTQPPAPGRFPSLISKIPIVGPLLKPYFEPVAVNVGDTPLQSSPQPLGPLHHTVPIQFGTEPLPQQSVYATGPALQQQPPLEYGYLSAGGPHVAPPLIQPGSFPLPVGNYPVSVSPLPPFYPQPNGNLFHTVPIDFGHNPSLHVGNHPVFAPPQLYSQPTGGNFFHTVPVDYGHNPSLQTFPPPPSFGNVPSGPLPVPEFRPPPTLGHAPTSGPLPVPEFRPPPTLGHVPSGPLPVPEFRPPPTLGHVPSGPLPVEEFRPPPTLGHVPSGPLPVSEFGPPPSLGPLPQGPPTSLGPRPNQPPPVIELGPPPSLGPRPQGPPPDADFLPKEPPSPVINLRPPTTPIQDPGLVVSKRNKNVLVNKFGGGVALPISRLPPTNCRTGRCNHTRDIKGLEATPITSENHLHSIEKDIATTDSTITEQVESSTKASLLQSL